MNWIT